MEIIDTHTHLYLDQFDNDFDEMIQRSFDCGIKKFVFPSISSKYNEKMLSDFYKEKFIKYIQIVLYCFAISNCLYSNLILNSCTKSLASESFSE